MVMKGVHDGVGEGSRHRSRMSLESELNNLGNGMNKDNLAQLVRLYWCLNSKESVFLVLGCGRSCEERKTCL